MSEAKDDGALPRPEAGGRVTGARAEHIHSKLEAFIEELDAIHHGQVDHKPDTVLIDFVVTRLVDMLPPGYPIRISAPLEKL